MKTNSQDSGEGLKACPFCGGPVAIKKDQYGYKLTISVFEHKKCPLAGETLGWYRHKENIIESWNTRPTQETTNQENERDS